MIRHLFKLIWNRRRRNYLLISEIFFSFVVLFAVATFGLFFGFRLAEPRGFEFEDIWTVRMNWEDAQQTDSLSDAQTKEIMAAMQQEMMAYDEVSGVTWTSSNVPWSGNQWSTSYLYEGIERDFHLHYISDEFKDVMQLSVIEGRWFTPDDDVANPVPVVLNRTACKSTFGNEPPLGQILTDDDEELPIEYVVVGVVDGYRYQGEMAGSFPSLFHRRNHNDTLGLVAGTALVRVRPDAGVDFQHEISRRLSEVTHGWTIGVQTLEEARDGYLDSIKMGAMPLVIIGVFLVFNVALGLFGILWYSISRRRSEIGVRRAAGARKGQISWQIIGEALVMATFAIMVGAILALQVPLLGFDPRISMPIYLLAIGCASIMIYLIVTVCAMYPSRLAARIQPAEALHDE